MKKTVAMLVSAIFVAGFAAVSVSAEAVDPAKALFEEKCSACHATDRPLSKNKDKSGWTETVKRMQSKKPGHITDDDAAKIADYLAKTRGPK